MRVVPAILVAVLVMTPRASEAQSAERVWDEPRIFVDVNLFGSASSLVRDRTFTSIFVVSGELGTFRANYPGPSRASLFPLVDLGGGYMITRSFAAGVSFSRIKFEDAAGLEATIPHPTFLNAPASDTGATDALTRRESATHIFAAYVPLRTDRAELRIFGGPSFFWYTADMVNDISYAQTFDPLSPQNVVTIDGFTSGEVSGSAIGFHLGGDFAYFFTRMFGMGAGVRFSRGTVTVDPEPLSQVSQEIRVGGTVVFLGVRIHLGG